LEETIAPRLCDVIYVRSRKQQLVRYILRAGFAGGTSSSIEATRHLMYLHHVAKLQMDQRLSIDEEHYVRWNQLWNRQSTFGSVGKIASSVLCCFKLSGMILNYLTICSVTELERIVCRRDSVN